MKRMLVLLTLLLFVVVPFAMAQETCEGNFDCDQDVDGTDAAVFKVDFGRSPFSNPCPNCPPPAPVEKTGQTTSYATGDDGDLEKGVAWPNPRFTDNDDGTITDNLTGLVWLKNANSWGEVGWDYALIYPNILESGMYGLTDGSISGNWRLPNFKELFSLVDAKNFDPALPSGHPFTNVQSAVYWTSTTYAPVTYGAWRLYMYDGTVDSIFKESSAFIWPVRDAQ